MITGELDWLDDEGAIPPPLDDEEEEASEERVDDDVIDIDNNLFPPTDTPNLDSWNSSTWGGRRIVELRKVVINKARHLEIKGEELANQKSNSYLFGKGLLKCEEDWYDDFQKEIINKALAERVHIISPATTSVGKTYVARRIAAGLSLSTNDRNALFISPNTEVLLENIEDIQKRFSKIYRFSQIMVGSQSYGFTSWDESNPPPCQIVCITAGNLIPFLLNPINVEWINQLSVVVFDEVHMDYVNRALWWLGQIGLHDKPIESGCQYVLLSATLGNVEQVCEDFNKLLKPSSYPVRPVFIAKLKIRPVPLQLMLWCPPDDYRISQAGATSMLEADAEIASRAARNVINWEDPTPSDCLAIEGGPSKWFVPQLAPPQARLTQWAHGQALVARFGTPETRANHQLLTQMQPCLLPSPDPALQGRPTMRNLLGLVQHLCVNNMHPIIIFDYDSKMAELQAIQLADEIERIEALDHDIKKFRDLYQEIKQIKEKVAPIVHDFFHHSAETKTRGQSKRKREKSEKVAAQRAEQGEDKEGFNLKRYLIERGISEEQYNKYQAVIPPIFINAINTWNFTKEEIPPIVIEKTNKAKTKKGKAKGNAEFTRKTEPADWICNLLKRGIGIYTENIPYSIRIRILKLFNEGKLPILFTGRELSVGVNLNVKTAITLGDQISRPLFYQMVGRAGRRGINVAGYAIPLASRHIIHTYYGLSEDPSQLTLKQQPNQTDLLTCYYRPPYKRIKIQRLAEMTPIVELIKRRLEQRCDNLQLFLQQLKIRSFFYNGYLTHRMMHSFLDFDEPRFLYWFELLRQGFLHNDSNPNKALWVICFIWGGERTHETFHLGPGGVATDGFNQIIFNQINDIYHRRRLPELNQAPIATIYQYLSNGGQVEPSQLKTLEEIEQALQILHRLTQNLAPEGDGVRRCLHQLVQNIDHHKSGSTKYVKESVASHLNTAEE